MIRLIDALEHLGRAEQLELGVRLDSFSRNRQRLTYKVASQSRKGHYYSVDVCFTDNPLHTYFSCNCEDHRIRGRPCKHIVYLISRYYHRIRDFHERTRILKELKTALMFYNRNKTNGQ